MYENICDCVFVCLQCICATSVTMCLCVCVLWCWPLRWKPCGSQWDGQVSYKYVMNSKTFGRELLARPRVVGVFWHERQEAWKLPKNSPELFKWIRSGQFLLFSGESLGDYSGRLACETLACRNPPWNCFPASLKNWGRRGWTSSTRNRQFSMLAFACVVRQHFSMAVKLARPPIWTFEEHKWTIWQDIPADYWLFAELSVYFGIKIIQHTHFN